MSETGTEFHNSWVVRNTQDPLQAQEESKDLNEESEFLNYLKERLDKKDLDFIYGAIGLSLYIIYYCYLYAEKNTKKGTTKEDIDKNYYRQLKKVESIYETNKELFRSLDGDNIKGLSSRIIWPLLNLGAKDVSIDLVTPESLRFISRMEGKDFYINLIFEEESNQENEEGEEEDEEEGNAILNIYNGEKCELIFIGTIDDVFKNILGHLEGAKNIGSNHPENNFRQVSRTASTQTRV